MSRVFLAWGTRMIETNTGMLFDARDVVGESLIWDDRRNRLVWVDIIGRRIHRLDPLTLAHEFWETPDLVTSMMQVDSFIEDARNALSSNDLSTAEDYLRRAAAELRKLFQSVGG